MIFNGSNVKVIRENGYLTKYTNRKAPYFPFTEEDIKNNILILCDNEYLSGRIFYLSNYDAGIAYFFGLSPSGARMLSFNFNSMVINVGDYKWGN